LLVYSGFVESTAAAPTRGGARPTKKHLWWSPLLKVSAEASVQRREASGCFTTPAAVVKAGLNRGELGAAAIWAPRECARARAPAPPRGARPAGKANHAHLGLK
jgi:hypothetical protein